MTMKTIKKISFGIFAAASLVMLTLSCEQPFKAGLGPVVDTRPPTVRLDAPGAGEYIFSDRQNFTGFAEDDYKLASVKFRITSSAGLRPNRQNDWSEYQPVPVSPHGIWECNIDTTAFFDGDLKIRVMAVDSVGKTSETEEISFYIKNDRPIVRMNMPSIPEHYNNEDTHKQGEAGGPEDLSLSHLNFGVVDVLPETFPKERKVFSKSSLMGMVSDGRGINTDEKAPAQPPSEEFPNGVPEKFPPQYRVWEISDDPGNPDLEAVLPVFGTGYFPSLAELPWSDFDMEDPLAKAKLTPLGQYDYQFSIDLDENTFRISNYYGFEIRAQSIDENYSSFRYPMGCWPDVTWSLANPGSDFEKENRYVLFYIRVPDVEPTIELYRLENLDVTSLTGEEYPVLQGLDAEGDYPYIDVSPSFKGGDFTLRIQAKHTEDVLSAEVYWEKEDRSEKGRFIWDPRSDASQAIYSGMLYSEWSMRDLTDKTARSFIFSYKQNGDNKIPVNAAMHPQVSGRSKIQQYIGPLEPLAPGDRAWNVSSKLSNKWPEDNSFNSSLWKEIDALDEGTYTIEVWATSRTKVGMSYPRTFTLTVDITPPDVDLGKIDGGEEYTITAADTDLTNIPGSDVPVYVVNGVVKPSLSITDSSSGPRTALSDYFRNPPVTGDKKTEQMYVLFAEGDGTGKTALDNAIAANPRKWWPIKPGTDELVDLVNTIGGITAPIFGSNVSFKTSPITAEWNDLEDGPAGANYLASLAAEPDALKDGFYWFYVFSRDNAFNVGIRKVLLKVDYETDFPVYDWSVSLSTNGNGMVTNPNVAADKPNIGPASPEYNDCDGFIVMSDAGGINVRNKFRPNDPLRFRVRDDDNVDLDNITVSFTGAYMSGSEIKAYAYWERDENAIKPYNAGDDDYIINVPLADNDKTPYNPINPLAKMATVTVSQTVLLEALKDNSKYDDLFTSDPNKTKEQYTSLPDGFYKFIITVADHAGSKLPNKDNIPLLTGPAVSIVRPVEFWVVVKAAVPVISDVTPEAGKPIGDIELIEGKVTDTTGPLYFVSATVSGPNQTGNPAADITWRGFVPSNPVKEGDFSAELNLHGNTGTFNVEIKFRDRFNNIATFTRKYVVDTEPPDISILRRNINTFPRNKDDVWERIQNMVTGGSLPELPDRLTVLGPVGAVRGGRLANGVVSFRFNVTDKDTGVESVRWWLIPKEESFPVGVTTNLDDTYDTVPTLGMRGEIDMINDASYYEGKGFDRWDVFVNSRDLNPPDGEYRLIIMARDKAGNITVPKVFTEVFFLQEEDKPYFDADSIKPGSRGTETVTVGKSSLKITGMINDDDGFDILPSPLQIRVFNSTPALALSPHTPPAIGDYTNGTLKLVKEGHYSIIGKNISLNIDLSDPEYGLDISTDGLRYYMLEATDNLGKKIAVPTSYRLNGIAVNPDITASRASEMYSFVYDTVPPDLVITYPEQRQTFGKNADEPDQFSLKGWMHDYQLKKNEDGKYFIKFALDNNVRGEFALETGDYTIAGVPAVDSDDPLEGSFVFTIDSVRFTDAIGFFIPEGQHGYLTPGPHSITFSVEDAAGNVTYATLSFIKDVSAPEFDFINIDKFPLDNLPADPSDPGRIGSWWTNSTGLSAQQWYQNKHNWLESQEPLSIITYERNSGIAPVLRGTVEDDESDIDPNQFYYWIDDALVFDPLSPGDFSADTGKLLETDQVEGSGKNIRWTVYLTQNGASNGTALDDGVHTIRISVADTAGNATEIDPVYVYMMYAFRIVSAPPQTGITSHSPFYMAPDPENPMVDIEVPYSVFGKYAATGPGIFTIGGTAASANLKDVRLQIARSVVPQDPTNPVDIMLSSGGSLAWSFTASPYEEQAAWSYTLGNDTYAAMLDGYTYEVIVTAVDQAGNESVEATWQFTKDTSPPEIGFLGGLKSTEILPAGEPKGMNPFSKYLDPTPDNSLNLNGANYRTQNPINVIYGGDGKTNITLRGSAIDNASSLSKLERKLEQWNWDDQTWVPISDWGALPAALSQDVYWAWPLGTTLAEGFYRIQLRAEDSAYPPNAIDPGDLEYVYFYCDKGVPSLDVTSGGDALKSYYSFAAGDETGTLSFSGTAYDSNGLRLITVRVYPKDLQPGDAGYWMREETQFATPAQQHSDGEVAWDLILTGLPEDEDITDTCYLEIIAYDMAGRRVVMRRTFTVDNSPPVGSVTEPASRRTLIAGDEYSYPLASAVTDFRTKADEYRYSTVVTGGKEGVMAGSFDDPGKDSSGIAGVWFHLGYLPDGAIPAETWFGNFPTEEMVKDTIVRQGAETENDALDRMAGEAGNAWFKLDSAYPQPAGIVFTNPDPYGWRFTITDDEITHSGGYKQFVGPITLKNLPSAPKYNDANADYVLTLPVPNIYQSDDGDLQRDNIYSMPVWFRLVDTVGNVNYYCHDIWIYPWGDIPSSSITNPPDTGVDGARGGQIDVNGVADHIQSVHSVIFRVFADNVEDTKLPLDGDVTYYYGLTPPSSANMVTNIKTSSPGVASVPDTSMEWDLMLNGKPSSDPVVPPKAPTYAVPPASVTGATTQTGWYYGVIPTNSINMPTASWNFSINTADEISKLITERGFASVLGGSKDTIRVWLEVFVFSGNNASLNEMSSGEKDFDNMVYKPYIKVFYINNSSPEIINQRIIEHNSDGNDYIYNPLIETVPALGKNFAIQADLYSNTANGLGLISVRRQDDSLPANRSWVDVWNKADGELKPGVTVTLISSVPYPVYKLTYEFDSWLSQEDAGAADLGAINDGDWKELGGSYQIEVRIRDGNSPPSDVPYTFVIGIDNFAPVATFDMNPKVAGSAVPFNGRIFDYRNGKMDNDPSERGLDRVIAWFSRDNGGTADCIPLVSGADGTYTLGSLPAYRNRSVTVDPITGDLTVTAGARDENGVEYPVTDGYYKVISKTTAGPGSGLSWSSNGQLDDDVEWVFTVDSTELPDGAMWFNYLVVDKAGNATFYQEQVVVMNHYPVITGVTLFTSNKGSRTVERQLDDMENVDEATATNVDRKKFVPVLDANGYLNTGFISKNRYVGFKVETISGNPPLNYRLQHVTRTSMLLNTATITQMVTDKTAPGAITLYTIEQTGNLGRDWSKLGARTIANGAHFVFDPQLKNITDPLNSVYDSGSDNYIDLTNAGGARIYRYTSVVSPYPEVVKDTPEGEPNPPVLPNEDDDPVEAGDGFNFYDDVFDAGGGAGKIGQFLGSQPDKTNGAATDGTANNPAATAFFLISVWDSVGQINTGSPFDALQLYDAVVIGMNVLLTDTTAPTIEVYPLNPNTETLVVGNNSGNSTELVPGTTDEYVPNLHLTIREALDPIGLGLNEGRGGLYNAKNDRELVSSGHIEPGAGSPYLDITGGDVPFAANETVSGGIIVRGRANDDQLIDEIWVKATEVSTGIYEEKPILKFNPATYSLEPVSPEHAEVFEQLHYKNGHLVEWAWLWNTEEWPFADGNPRDNVILEFKVIDRNGPNTGTTNGAAVPAEKAVDIAPYITGFERELPKYATKRSLQGWYSFFQGEENIKVLGYNLNPSAATVILDDGANDYTLAANGIILSVPDDAVSGRIVLTTSKAGGGSIDAINHDTDGTKSWNSEYFSRTFGSDLWDNKPFAHIWSTTQNDGSVSGSVSFFGNGSNWGGSMNAKDPAMKLIYNGPNSGKLYGAWIDELNQSVHQSVNDWDPIELVNRARENVEPLGPYDGVDIGYYHSTDLVETPNHANIVYNYFSQGSHILGRDAGMGEDQMVPGQSSMLSAAQTGTPSDRYKNIRTSRTRRSNLTSFYDSFNRRLMFSLSYFAGAVVSPNYTTQYPGAAANTPAVIIDGPGSDVGVTVNGAGTSNAGLYSAIDFITVSDTVSTPVIAYYDQIAETVRIAHSTLTERTRNHIIRPTASGTTGYPFSGTYYEFSYHGLKINQEIVLNPTVNPDGSISGGAHYFVEFIGYYSNTGGGTFFMDAEGGPLVVLRQRAGNDPNGAWGTRYSGAVTDWYLAGEQYMIVNCTMGPWTRESLLSQDDLFRNAGTYISMKVDNEDNIHMAFLNTRESALVYAMGHFNAGAFVLDEITKVADVIQGAIRIDLSLDDEGNPFIVYGDNSRIGGYDGIRMAYKSDFFSKGDGWETVQMPSPYTTKNDRLSIEAWPPNDRLGGDIGAAPAGGWNAAIGYASDMYRIGFFTKPGDALQSLMPSP